ncbi:MAG: hypothetical protein GTN71_12815 [Anaerolineae bacterium]|nr:hypothetical protein [Anaerolineae bacterium]
MSINVLLSGRLKLDGYGRGKPENGDRYSLVELKLQAEREEWEYQVKEFLQKV